DVFSEARLAFEATPFSLFVAGLSTLLAMLGLLAGWTLYRNLPARAPDPLQRMPGYHFLKNKWYVDEFYRVTFVALSYFIADASSNFDRTVIDKTVNTIGEAGRSIALDLRDYFDTLVIEGLVNGSGKLSVLGGQLLRSIQTGRAQN